MKPFVERCWILVGQHRGRIWLARRVRPTIGEAVSVRFDGAWALRREESHGDVIGFYHTHPDGSPTPSHRDLRTMRAWCSSFGKPMLCLIESPRGIAGYRFDGHDSNGVALKLLEKFPRATMIGVDENGE